MNAISHAVAAAVSSDSFVAPNGMTLQRSKLYVDGMGRFIAKFDATGAQLDASATDHAVAYYLDHNLMTAENVPSGEGRFSYDEAQTFIAEVRESSHGGFGDWDLPSPDQGAVTVDYSREDPAVDLSVHPGSTSSAYWTNQQTSWTKGEAGSSRSFFYVYMGYGNVSHGGAGGRLRARPVRRAVPAGQWLVIE
jgi:hypothetical protein